MLGMLKMTILLSPPDKRKRDVDNYHKAALDALARAGVYANDCQIKSMRTIMSPCPSVPGMIKILIEQVSQDAMLDQWRQEEEAWKQCV